MMEFVPRRSLIHSLHPLTKLLWSLVIMILSILFDEPWVLAVVIISVLVVGIIGRVTRETALFFSAMLAISVVVFIFQVFFRPVGPVYFTVFPSSWPVVGGWLPVTQGGVMFGIAMVLRMICIVSPFSVILATTQPRDIIMALVNTLHVPYDYAFLFTTTLRFIPVITAEVATISQAQRSRAYDAIEGWNPVRKIMALAPISLPIVFIAIEKADRLGLCMDLRGYGSKGRTYLREFSLGALDWIAIVAMVIVTIACVVASFQGFGHMVLPQ